MVVCIFSCNQALPPDWHCSIYSLWDMPQVLCQLSTWIWKESFVRKHLSGSNNNFCEFTLCTTIISDCPCMLNSYLKLITPQQSFTKSNFYIWRNNRKSLWYICTLLLLIFSHILTALPITRHIKLFFCLNPITKTHVRLSFLGSSRCLFPYHKGPNCLTCFALFLHAARLSEIRLLKRIFSKLQDTVCILRQNQRQVLMRHNLSLKRSSTEGLRRIE